jgi:hypothetical protein
LDQGVAELVTVWTVSGVPVRVVMGSRRYRVVEDPAPVFVAADGSASAEWDLQLVSLQPPPERLQVTVQPGPGGRWQLLHLDVV